MRFLSTLFLALLAPLAFAHSTHRSHMVEDDGSTRIEVVRESDGEQWASFEKNGVRYLTTDASVIAEIDKAFAKHREISLEHSRLGRRHSELGREYSRLGREHSRIGREASRSGMTEDLERQQRELEKEQQKLEDKQRALEEEQRELEEKQSAAEKDATRAIEKIFEEAIRSGKARRN